jgi:hypothetical protein
MWTSIVGFQVAELSPVIPDAVTTATTPSMATGLFATYVAVPTFVMLPAVYPSSAAPIVGPPSGVNAVEMTVATHPDPAAALRASLTCT